MEIKETMYEKKLVFKQNNPYLAALDMVKKISSRIGLSEKKNFYETDGPHHRFEIVVESNETHDNFSKTIFAFSFSGEEKTLEVLLEGRFEVAVAEYGFFSETFSQFYIDRVFPVFRKRSELRIKEIASVVETMVQKVKA